LPLGAKLRIDLWAIYGGPGGAVESRVITADDDPNKERSISMFISTKKLNALGGLGPGNTQPFYKKVARQGCQMVCLQTKNPNLGKFWRALCRMEKCRYILWPFEIFYGHLVYFMAIGQRCGNLVYFPSFWYIVSEKIWQPCSSLEKNQLADADATPHSF
jgi:hypothetical protein